VIRGPPVARVRSPGGPQRPQEVSEEKALRKLYQTRNE
jgi:hypothetical protein